MAGERTTCPDCNGQGVIHNENPSVDLKCSRCGGLGLIELEMAKRILAQRNATAVIEALTKRAYKAFDEGDDETATLLRKACQLIREGMGK